jgi:glycosyltransferase involved in cell wall biosynthesis
MYRIRLHYDRHGWAYHRRCTALTRFKPDDFEVDMGAWHPCIGIDDWPHGIRYDLVLQLVPDLKNLAALMESRGNRDAVLVGGLNVGFGHHQERLRMCRTGADHIVINNKDCWERLGKPPGTTWISNGVDRDQFHVVTPIERRRPKVIWTGCKFHVYQTKIKGYHEYLVPLGEELAKRGIDYEWHMADSDFGVGRWSMSRMAEWYQSGTVLVCASSSEGTPNPALEAASCGCAVVSTPVGNMPELIRDGVNGRLVERTVPALLEGVLDAVENYRPYAEAMQGSIQRWHWKYRARQYYDLFRSLITGGG